jgi:membrane-bound serine protease (ClpP class)
MLAMKGCSPKTVNLVLLLVSLTAATAHAKDALLLDVDGTLGPATVNYITTGLKQAAREQDGIVILRLNTPGGFTASTQQINNLILTSAVPVVTYIAPAGALAANAGIFVLYASPVAAMSPNTLIGEESSLKSNADTQDLQNIKKNNLSAQEIKKLDSASAYIIGLAKIHGRSSAWAEDALRNAASLTPENALKQNVINVIASTPAELLQKINGMRVNLHNSPVTLDTQNLKIKTLQPNWRNQILAAITDPNIAYILLLVGIYALFLEFFHPGIFLPGIAGVLAIVVALYAFQMLPINYAGFALLVLGITFMIIEVQVISFGIMGLGGIIAFVLGSILLLNINSPGYQIAWSLILTMTVISALFFLCMVTLAARNRNRKVVTGREAILGAEGIVEEIFNSKELLVKINGELWKATAQNPVKKGQKIRISGLTGLTLKVEPLNETDLTSVFE